jgi:hypothetical protein
VIEAKGVGVRQEWSPEELLASWTLVDGDWDLVANKSGATRWGRGAACASDSKKFRSWSSNFMTEYHARYGGNDVMIYWHVERKNVCIYSQLKSCSSSEVAAMIEGLLRHCTDAEIESNYVDTHGASVVGFAFTELLNFRLPASCTSTCCCSRSCPSRRGHRG